MNEFGSVFGPCGNDAVDKLGVTNIIVSKQNNKVDIELANELSTVIEDIAEKQIKKRQRACVAQDG